MYISDHSKTAKFMVKENTYGPMEKFLMDNFKMKK